MDECKNVETWITLPKHQRPSSWSKFRDPVCLLRLNLYGHPLAGLFWEKYSEKQLFKEGFQKCKGWECLYVHKEMKLFLSVYVDDYKMAGKAENVSKMWERLGKRFDLEPPVPFHNTVYLGCQQSNITIPEEIVNERAVLMSKILDKHSQPHSEQTERSATTETTVRGGESHHFSDVRGDQGGPPARHLCRHSHTGKSTKSKSCQGLAVLNEGTCTAVRGTLC